MKISLSVIKADIGGYVGHSSSHPEILAEAQRCLEKAKKSGLLVDFHVTRCGDDLQLIMTLSRVWRMSASISCAGIRSFQARRSPRSWDSMERGRTCLPMPSPGT